MTLVASLLLVPFATFEEPNLDGPFHIDVRPSHQVEVTLTETLKAPGLNASKCVIAAGLPPSFEAQRLGKAEIYIPTAPRVPVARKKERSFLTQEYLQVEVDAGNRTSEFKAQAIYDVTFMRRELKAGSSGEVPFPLGDKRPHYLKNGKYNELGNGAFKAWMEREGLTRKKEERDLKFAWKVFHRIATEFEYDSEPVEDLRPMATISAKSSTTYGLANLFVSIMRSNDIPCRYLVGRILRPFEYQFEPYETTTLEESTCHVTAEFWAEGIGWVPVDIVSAAGFHEPFNYFGKDGGGVLVMNFEEVSLAQDWTTTFERMRWDRSVAQGSWSGAQIQRKVELELKKVFEKKDGEG